MTSCIVCGNNVKKIKIFDKLPVSSAHLSFNTVDIELKSKFEALVCDCCQHISNQSAITDFIYTSPNYVVKRAVSGTMSSLLTTVYDFLLTNAPNIKNKKILEIGSGSGELALSLGRAGAVVYTIDPAVKDYNTSFINHNSCSFENFQSTQKYDLIIVRHVLEHTSDPKHFLGRINELLTEDGSVYIEVPNLVTTLLNYRAIDFFNDHIQHFSSKSLKHLLVCCGLGIINRLDLVRNNHIGFFATKGVESIDLDEDKIESIDWYLEKSKDKLLKIYSLIYKANSIALYGAGAHATTFVSQLDQDSCNKVKYVLDKDPSKQGRYIPGLTVAVTEPSKGKTCQLIINTAVLYADEINHYILNNLNHQGTIINL